MNANKRLTSGEHYMTKHTSQSQHYIIICPPAYYNIDKIQGQELLLDWLEMEYDNGHELVSMLPNGLSLFRKVFLTPVLSDSPRAEPMGVEA